MIALLLAATLAASAAEPPTPALDPRCYRREVTNNVPLIVYLGDRVCVDFEPPRIFEGLWIDAFEGSSFIAGARSLADRPATGESVWLTIDAESRVPARFRRARYPAQVYRVRFRGRGARDMHRRPLEGYGHLGMSAGVVLVDEMLAMESLGPVRRR